ncbi:MAG: nucleoside triphosphate pyrophosphohydrolase family protein [Christensenellales bacterium]
MRTCSLDSFQGLAALQNAALGLAGESGEFADSVKKVSFQGHELDRPHLKEEIGDILWYCALAAKALNADLHEIALDNIEKLRRRYPEGFQAERSIHRQS